MLVRVREGWTAGHPTEDRDLYPGEILDVQELPTVPDLVVYVVCRPGMAAHGVNVIPRQYIEVVPEMGLRREAEEFLDAAEDLAEQVVGMDARIAEMTKYRQALVEQYGKLRARAGNHLLPPRASCPNQLVARLESGTPGVCTCSTRDLMTRGCTCQEGGRCW